MATEDDLKKYETFVNGGHPDYVPANSLDIHLIWCVWHEGLKYYNRDSKMNENNFRDAALVIQNHNRGARDIISRASKGEIEKVASEMHSYFNIQGNGGNVMVGLHLKWVMDHEGRRNSITNMANVGTPSSCDAIRAIFHGEQSHNSHVKNILNALMIQGC